MKKIIVAILVIVLNSCISYETDDSNKFKIRINSQKPKNGTTITESQTITYDIDYSIDENELELNGFHLEVHQKSSQFDYIYLGKKVITEMKGTKEIEIQMDSSLFSVKNELDTFYMKAILYRTDLDDKKNMLVESNEIFYIF